MRILLAFDKFKGSLTAVQVAEAAQRGLQRSWPEVEVVVSPIADGGEGFTEAVLSACEGEGRWMDAKTHDAQGRPMKSRYGIVQRDGEAEAVMEMSAASGLALVKDLPLNPHLASTYGTGEMMLHALDQGVKRLLIGIGGSATNDGGCGMAMALGCRFLDKDGAELGCLPADLDVLDRIDASGMTKCEVLVACDVDNPLLGEKGASTVYGPQKGVQEVGLFDGRLQRLAEVVKRDLGCDHRLVPGAGAAGGLGFGLMSFCGAELRGGFDIVADLSGLRARIEQADLVITGEGRMDGQTLHGKGPHGVALMARELGKPVVGIAGMVESDAGLEACFDGLVQVKPESMSCEEAIANAAVLVEETVAQRADWLKDLVSNR
ncbi:glycerate kinase [Phragmitibacter flavus]|nr:glycerate kinase [Phragmitibacter flavus]